MNEDIKVSIVKYITGQATAAEALEVKEWIKASSENEAYFIQLYEAWHNSLSADPKLIDADEAFSSFMLKKTGLESAPVLKKLRFWPKLTAAAAVILMCSAGVYYYEKLHVHEEWLIVKVPNGLTRKVTLPDGSFVWINSGSNIRYSKTFGKTDRTIFLAGEAYFDIAKTDKNIPFLVKTDQFTIRDVGTVFNVKAYPDEKIFETAVVEGKVSVEGILTDNADYQSKVFLDAKQVLKINKKITGLSNKLRNKIAENLEPVKVIQIDEAQVNEYNGWKDDVLVFEDDSFEDITNVLERKYNVRIDISDERLKNYRYTGAFKNITNISTVFKVIKETTPIDFTINGSVITIKRN